MTTCLLECLLVVKRGVSWQHYCVGGSRIIRFERHINKVLFTQKVTAKIEKTHETLHIIKQNKSTESR